MRASTAHIERYRSSSKTFPSDASYGMNGIFVIPDQHKRSRLIVIASNQLSWEHISAHVRNENRVPSYADMCYLKSLFWDENEWVIQYFPAKDDHINVHPFVLHLWKPLGVELPKPPKIFV